MNPTRLFSLHILVLALALPTRDAVPEWIDPEPAGKQALAEQVLGADWNKNKTRPLAEPSTTVLKMRMTTLIFNRTEIQGLSSAVGGGPTSLADRLSRLNARETETEITIALLGSILFNFDQFSIRPDAQRTLNDVVGVINAYAGKAVRVEGHTDSVGGEDYNIELSEKRAGSVLDWLKAHGAETDSMKLLGFGESKPVADNTTAPGRQKNRRVEIIIQK